MIQIETKCFLCGQTSAQPLDAPLAYAAGGGNAMLDGLDLGQPRRGMKVCAGCRACAPDLVCPVPGLGAAAIRDGLASAAFRDALAARAALLGAPDAARPDAMRWLAYATVFGRHLSPGEAGRAWAWAAAELELPRLRPPGAEWEDPAPRPDLAIAARHEAARRLDRAVRADFPVGNVLPAGLSRMLRRRLAGEAARESACLHPDGEGGFAWRRDLGRFDNACLLAELYRRLGRFAAAQEITALALADGRATADHVAVLRRQSWLALSQDDAPHLLRRPATRPEALPEAVPQAMPEAAPVAAGQQEAALLAA